MIDAKMELQGWNSELQMEVPQLCPSETQGTQSRRNRSENPDKKVQNPV